MVSAQQDHGVSAIPHPEIDVEQRRRGKELSDRLDRLRGRCSASDGSTTQNSNHLSTEFASASNKDSSDSVRGDKELWHVQADHEVVRVLPESAVECAQRDAEADTVGTPAKSEEAALPAPRDSTPSPATPPPANPHNSSESSPDRGNGIHGTVKSLKNHRDIDFSVPFVSKKHKKRSA